MNKILRDNFDNDFIICRTPKKKEDVGKSHIIVLKEREDIETIITIFSKNISVYAPDFKNDEDILQWLKTRTYEDFSVDTISDAGHKKITDLCEKIGLPKRIINKVLQKKDKVEKSLVHKENLLNVMVSDSERVPNTNVFYLRGFLTPMR